MALSNGSLKNGKMVKMAKVAEMAKMVKIGKNCAKVIVKVFAMASNYFFYFHKFQSLKFCAKVLKCKFITAVGFLDQENHAHSMATANLKKS